MRKPISPVTTSEVISQLRFPLIVLVTYAHSYGAVSGDYSLLSQGWDGYAVLRLLVSQTLVKVVVPVFFIISGYLFFRNVDEWNVAVYGRKLRRRAKSLLLPYLVWNVLMAVKLRAFGWTVLWAFWQKAGRQIDWLGMENTMTAPADMPLWFLRDLMVVTLFTPIIYICLRRLGAWLMGALTVVYLSGVGAFAVPGLSVYALYFFSLGAWLGIRKVSPIEASLRLETAAYVLSVVLGVAMLLAWQTRMFSSLMLGFRLTGAVAVFCLAYRLLSATSCRLPQPVCRSAYFIYLAHYVFFLSFVDVGIFRMLGSESAAALSVHYLLAPLLKAGLFVGAYWGYYYLSRRKK